MQGISLVDVGIEWFKDAIDTVTEWFSTGITSGYSELSESLLSTPTPETERSFVFGTPTNEPWIALHDALVGGEILLVALLLLISCVQGRHTVRIFNIGSRYESRKTKRTAWTGGFLIVTWYWVGVLSLYLVNGFTIALIPDVSVVSSAMLDFMQVSVVNPALALSLAALGGVAMWTLQALLFIREILLYVYLYGMPLAFALMFGNLPVVSRIARSLSLKFVPLAVMPLPVAVLFKAYALLFSEGTGVPYAPQSAFLSYLLAVSLPVLAVIVVWKLFKYASPLTATVIGSATSAAVTAGAVITAGSVAGPYVASTAVKWGPKAAAGQAMAQRVTGDSNDSDNGGTNQDNVVTDAYGQRGIPSYRRTENDPGYY
ncbi:hypothetical protein [Halorarum salinum]|uniref:Type IV secretion system protein TrbL n=1 Tax=Halorarum salinum TaxID=2743089 RepID=A0A7D5L8J4_9EURY|nr:hypothetical protein [Halobaculum salinum]QLG60275.1 hypothetical protein HUG12_00240 [Halobaculum salinum]